MNSKEICKLAPIEKCCQITETTLLLLDDMALFAIMKYLNIIALSHLFATCKRLKILVCAHVQKHHTNVHWMRYMKSEVNSIGPRESEEVFRNFGKYIRTIRLTSWSSFEFYEILLLVAQECTHIDTLILESVRMSRPQLLCDPLIKLMFKKLKRFVLSGCYWQGWCPLNNFFGDNETLEDLAVTNCCAYNGRNYRLHMSGFRSLKKLRLLRCRNVVTGKELVACFENNNIKSVMLSDIGNVHVFLDNVIECLSDTVDDLSVDFCNEINSNQLSRLKKLRTLRLHCNTHTDMDEFLSNVSTGSAIEELFIVRVCISSQTIEALKQFKNLKRLKMDRSLNSVPRQFFRAIPKILPQLQHFVYTNSTIRDEDILYMFNLMPQLARLCLFGCNSLATETYLEMADILENDWHRPKVEFILPKFETVKSLQDVKNIKKKLWLRTDIAVICPRSL
ncbi:uncharacterized protein LOC119069692 [Bradysia coprophila]|uniref:uncharacterized protein LOC119069692 n=1 Tax=Bradysia coprophila TaxID=38358 RepID=UPI00187DC6B3|nr:uncharacterized protein LOC119069692 [Bradysia coprophila]XP_037029716.1 uncharacterized protein LOC119069692 [Bradysia coprophila]